MAVALRDRLLELELISPIGVEHQVTAAGEAWFARLGVDVKAARAARRSFARACLDWSERRPHLAGALGDAMLEALVERGWIRRHRGERAVDLTEAGRLGLAALGLTLPDLHGGPAASSRPAAAAGAATAPRLARAQRG